jgi:hypothetical protein
MSQKEKDVELIPSNGASGWQVKHGSNIGSGPSNYPKVSFPANSGPHLVVFKIADNNVSSTATFNATDPMWIKQGNSSPTSTGMDPQIADWAIFDGGKTLVLLDTNSQAGDLSYRVKADNYGPVLDPIIRNGGTTTPPAGGYSFTTTEIAIAASALLVAFLIGFYVNRMFFSTK